MSDEVKHRLDLVGMKYTFDMPYFDKLPTSFIKCEDIKVFFKLKKHKRKIHRDNLEKIVGMEYIVYSPATLRYWYLNINEHTNMRKIYNYFKDGNVFVTADARAPVDEDSILY